jgi:hypothetical protein
VRLVTTLQDPALRADLARRLSRPCGLCGDVARGRAGFVRLEPGVLVVCSQCVREIPERVASSPQHFVGAILASDEAADMLTFSLNLREAFDRGNVPLRFAHLFDFRRWPSC